MKKHSKKINRKKDADLLLVQRAKKGDYRAFDLLVLKYQSRLINLSFGLVKDRYLAEDITQESFIKAYNSLDSFREQSSFYTWIYRITSNTAKNYLSSKRRKKETLVSELMDESQEEIFGTVGADSPEDILAANDLRDMILDSFSKLPEDIRTALSLREFEGLSYEEIANVLACPIGTVRSRIYRGRETIQEKINFLNEGRGNKHEITEIL